MFIFLLVNFGQIVLHLAIKSGNFHSLFSIMESNALVIFHNGYFPFRSDKHFVFKELHNASLKLLLAAVLRYVDYYSCTFGMAFLMTAIFPIPCSCILNPDIDIH